MALTQTEVSQLYVSIFGRASEGSGNAFWQTEENMESAANDMLATDDAAAYFGDSLDSDQAFIEHIYLNTLSKTVADDPEGVQFWVDALEAGNSRGFVVAELIDAVYQYADSTDPDTMAAYNQFVNRVEVSNYMADTVEDAPDDYATSTSFNGDLVVTDDPSTVGSAKDSVDDIANADWTLLQGVADLEAAQTAEVNFYETVDLDGDGEPDYDGDDEDTLPDSADVDDLYTDAIEGAGEDDGYDDLVNDSDYRDDSPALRAALLSAQEGVNAAVLTDVTAVEAAAQAEVNEVAGLSAAITAFDAAVDAYDAADDALDIADADVLAAEAYYVSLNGGSGDDHLTLDEDDGWILVEGVTEEDYPGITAVADTLNAQVAADEDLSDADDAADAAYETMTYLDLNDDALDALADLGAGMTIITPEDADAPTQAEVASETAALDAIYDTEYAADPTSPETAAADAAVVAFAALSSGFDDAADANELSDALESATLDVEDAQEDIDDLADAVDAVAAAEVIVDERDGLVDDIDAAEQAFVDNDLIVSTLEDGDSLAASAGDDVYMANGLGLHDEASIVNLGLIGDDVVYAGVDYTFNDGDWETDGDDSVLEAFMFEDGADTVIFLETVPFGSNSDAEEVSAVVLTGIAMEDVSFADGMFTVA